MVRWFGTTISETMQAFERPHLGRSARQPPTKEDKNKALVRIVISLALTVVGVYFVASGDDAQRTVGASLLAAVTGYWLK